METIVLDSDSSAGEQRGLGTASRARKERIKAGKRKRVEPQNDHSDGDANQVLIVESFKKRRPNTKQASGSTNKDTTRAATARKRKGRRALSPARNDSDLMLARLEAAVEEHYGPAREDNDEAVDALLRFFLAAAEEPEAGDQDQGERKDDEREDDDDDVQIEDPLGNMLAKVLIVVPDVLPQHAYDLLEASLNRGSDAVDYVVGTLLEEGGAYPKVQEQQDGGKAEEEQDWLDVDARKRQGEKPTPHYKQHAIDHLLNAFRHLPINLIKSEFAKTGSFYAPTFYELTMRDRTGEFVAKKLKRGRKATNPRKRLVWVDTVNEDGQPTRQMQEEADEVPPSLAQEKRWIEAKIAREDAERLAKKRAEEKEARAAARVDKLNERAKQRGEAIECGCCFDEIAFENTAQCADGHLFCKTCAAANADNRIGQRQPTLPCMAPECSATFLPITYSSFLKPKIIDTLAELAQQKDLEAAFDGVDGFEKCPFCPFACYIENKDERLFHCRRPDCGKVSCRQCKLDNHIPLSCEEPAKEKSLSSVHTVEEAMTAALIKHCPSSKVPTLKQDGCNKMTCSDCRIFWCHRCGKQIAGYDHFAQGNNDTTRCPTFDDTAVREHAAIEAARLQAQADLDGVAREAAEKLANAAPVRNAPILQQGVRLFNNIWNGGQPAPQAQAQGVVHHQQPAGQQQAQLAIQQAQAQIAYQQAQAQLAVQQAQAQAMAAQAQAMAQWQGGVAQAFGNIWARFGR